MGNTKNIHEIAYKYYEGPSINPPVIKGQNINFIDASSTEDQLNSILKITNDLNNQENINLSKIVILIANSNSYQYYFNLVLGVIIYYNLVLHYYNLSFIHKYLLFFYKLYNNHH